MLWRAGGQAGESGTPLAPVLQLGDANADAFALPPIGRLVVAQVRCWNLCI